MYFPSGRVPSDAQPELLHGLSSPSENELEADCRLPSFALCCDNVLDTAESPLRAVAAHLFPSETKGILAKATEKDPGAEGRSARDKSTPLYRDKWQRLEAKRPFDVSEPPKKSALSDQPRDKFVYCLFVF